MNAAITSQRLSSQPVPPLRELLVRPDLAGLTELLRRSPFSLSQNDLPFLVDAGEQVRRDSGNSRNRSLEVTAIVCAAAHEVRSRGMTRAADAVLAWIEPLQVFYRGRTPADFEVTRVSVSETMRAINQFAEADRAWSTVFEVYWNWAAESRSFQRSEAGRQPKTSYPSHQWTAGQAVGDCIGNLLQSLLFRFKDALGRERLDRLQDPYAKRFEEQFQVQ